jgi:hypothetical protein
MVIFILMKLFLLLLLLTPFYHLSAQITEESPGWYNGENVHQKDIDSLFKANPKAEELSITYLDSTLILPNFTELDILGIRSETLQNLQLPDLMPNLGLLDLYSPKLHAISAVHTPELFELMIHAQLDSFPAFLCNSPELTLVDITNYKSISVPGCLANLFLEDKLDISTLEIYDKKDGNLLIELKNPSYDAQAAELAATVGLTEALPDAAAGNENNSRTPHLDKFESLKGSDATAYFKEHKKAINAEARLR